MGILNGYPRETEGISQDRANGFSLRTRLLATIIPSVALILMFTGYVTYKTSSLFLGEALERSTRLQVKAMAHEVESIFTGCREDLLFISQFSSDNQKLNEVFAGIVQAKGTEYRDLIFISQKTRSPLILMVRDKRVFPIDAKDARDIQPDPLVTVSHLEKVNPGQVWISGITAVEHPFPSVGLPGQRGRSIVIYFGTPCFNGQGEKTGYLLLSLDARFVRNRLSLFNSPRSPLWAFTRTSETRFSFLFDLDGWILFQSEGPETMEADLATHLARLDYSYGTLGKPGLPFAFRPGSIYRPFWKMVSEIGRAHV